MHPTDQNQVMAQKIAQGVKDRGGTAYYVGGCVRDLLFGQESKDIDIEVHGIPPAVLEEILDGLGQRLSIGESFGIYNLKGYSLDIAMPRKEALRGKGHKDFDIFVDPFAGTYQAALRRDFTVNAMMQEVLSGEIIDHFGGQRDLQAKVLRHVNPKTFVEDPLRVLRGAQFAARFEFQVAEETVMLCRQMELSPLSRERVETELKKALLKAERPSVFFSVLREMEQLDVWFPELKALIGVEQNPKHHAEGDVWTHTMMVLDEGAKYRAAVTDPFGFLLGCLTHDFGKATCTAVVNGEIHAYDHEIEGVPMAKRFLRRMTEESNLIAYVLNLVELHMKPNTLAAVGASVKSTNRMLDRAMDPVALLCLARADGLGKLAPRPYVSYDEFFRERLAVYREYMARPYVMGKDLIEAGLKPGKYFSDLLAFAHKLRLVGIEKSSALKQTLAYGRQKYPELR